MCSEVAVSMVLICAGMSSGPSVSWLHPAFSGASRPSAVIRSSSTDGSAFSWIVSDAEVWRMNSVTAPSLALGVANKFRDLGGEIDEAGAWRLDRKKRRHDGGRADGGWRGAR